MSDALGTSTPTSMTVVATSTSTRASVNAAIAASFSAGASGRARDRRADRAGPSARSRAASSAARHATASDSSMAVQTQYACSPPAHARRIRATTSGRRARGRDRGVDRGGFPAAARRLPRCRDRRTRSSRGCGGSGSRSSRADAGASSRARPCREGRAAARPRSGAARSTMTSPRFAKVTCDWNSACVPTAIAAVPAAMSAVVRARSRLPSRPDSQATRTPSGSSQSRKLLKCCSASSSVGAMSAT